jgi:hypothetical protein
VLKIAKYFIYGVVMKKLTLDEAKFLAESTEDIVPTNLKLWQRSVRLYEGRNHVATVKYYENLGGAWTVQNKTEKQNVFKNVEIVEEDVSDIPDMFGLDNSPSTKRWLKLMKQMDPEFYRRMESWDQ